VLHLAPDGTILSQTGGFVHVNAVAANQADGSCWVDDYAGTAANNSSDLVHLAEDGTELLRIGGFDGPLSLSVNATDGSCWVGETWHDLIHLATDGTELWRGGLGGENERFSVSVNPADGSCWVADGWNYVVAHLAEDGAELWRDTGPTGPLSVNPGDGSCWVATSDEVVHLAEDGTELWRIGMSCADLAVNPTDGSCWVGGGTEAVHLAENGAELWRGAGFDFELHGSVSVNSTDGSCWLIHVGREGGDDSGYGLQLVHLSEDGVELWRRDADFCMPGSVSTSLGDGSCWVADGAGGQTVRLAADGTELRRADVAAFLASANSADGSCWLGTGSGEVIHLAADGTELLRVGGLTYPTSISVNPTDGSCWVAVHDFFAGTPEVVHLAESGAVLLRFTAVDQPSSVSVNPADGSCWVADLSSGPVVHLASDGTELWRGGPTYAGVVSANPVDGSCWVSVDDGGIVHLAEDGTELWRGNFFYGFGTVSVNPMDGSCWAGQSFNGLIHLAEDGAELWRGGASLQSHQISVNLMDGSCWVAQVFNGQVVRLEVVGYEGPHFLDIMPYHWAFDEVEACADAEIVGGYGDGLYRPARSVTRDQMAVFISRALAGATVPAGPAEATFDDVPTDYWAYDHIEYAVAANIVGGYEDGTYQPRLLLDRGQMAVFIARAMAGDDQSVPDPVGDPTFPDVTPDSDWAWCCKHVEYIAAEEVAGGYSDGLYHPEYPCSRDQMAVFICRAFHLT
jgi:hypothetical protein